MVRYKVQMLLLRNPFTGRRIQNGYKVYRKLHWWSRWQCIFITQYPQKAVDYINSFNSCPSCSTKNNRK